MVLPADVAKAELESKEWWSHLKSFVDTLHKRSRTHTEREMDRFPVRIADLCVCAVCGGRVARCAGVDEGG